MKSKKQQLLEYMRYKRADTMRSSGTRGVSFAERALAAAMCCLEYLRSFHPELPREDHYSILTSTGHRASDARRALLAKGGA